MSIDTVTNRDARAEYIAGLRALADLLEINQHLCLPLGGCNERVPLNIYPRTKATLADWVRALPGTKAKSADDAYFMVGGVVGGLHVRLNAWRDEVCERVVVDTREITEEIPDPELVATVPLVSVTRTEEIVEWRCLPVLAEDVAA